MYLHGIVLYYVHSVKDITGYDPKDLVADGVTFTDFIHPADLTMMKHRPKMGLSE